VCKAMVPELTSKKLLQGGEERVEKKKTHRQSHQASVKQKYELSLSEHLGEGGGEEGVKGRALKRERQRTMPVRRCSLNEK